MNNISVLYVGVDPQASDQLKSLSLKLGWEIRCLPSFSSYEKLRDFTPDVCLVDLDGVKIEQELIDFIGLKNKVKLLFLTASDDEQLYIQYRKILPIGYVVKPFSPLQLRALIETSIFYLEADHKAHRLLQSWKEEEELQSTFFIKNNHKLIKVKQSDILAVMADGNYCVIITPQRRHAVKISLRRIKLKLSTLLFRQIHRNFIIQLPKVESVDLSAGEVALAGENYPIGGSYRQEFLEYLDRI